MIKRFRIAAALAAVAVLVVFGVEEVRGQSDTDVAGTVTRLQGRAVAMQDALPRPLKVGDSILVGDVVSTGKGARIELKMLDDAVMTLGAKTVFVVVDYLVTGARPNAAMRLLQGAFSAVSGKMMQTADASFIVSTETATIGVRGTTFWGGTLDGDFEVALLDGKGVYVETKAGRVELTRVGDGTRITGADAPPGAPVKWDADKTARAVATVAFDK